jgi:DNA-binding MarR family transcriptional regulator
MEFDFRKLRELIRLLERKLGVLEDSEYSCCGVSFAQCHAIVELGRNNGISLNSLAETLGLDNSTMSRTVNNLVVKRLAKREPDPGDRRYIRIALTPKGRKLFTDIETGMENFFEHAFENIPEDKRSLVFEGLEILLHALDTGCCSKPVEHKQA